MATKTNNFKIGVFVLIGVALLLGGLFAFGIRSQLEPKTLFETYATGDVEGLSVGSLVTLRGVPVGRVTRINFTWNDYPDGGKGYVVVEFEIKDSVTPLPKGGARDTRLLEEIRKGLRARIKGQGITGTSIVSLEYLNPEENPPLQVDWTPAAHYIPSAPGQFSQMLSSIEKSLRNIEKVDFELLNLSLQNSLNAVGKVLGHLEAMEIASIGTNVNGLVSELRTTNTKLKEFLDETRGAVRSMELDGLSRRADGLLGQIKELVARLDSTVAGLDTGSLGPTLRNAQEATGQLNDILHNLKQYPSGFLFGQPPAPARSVDKTRP